MKDILDRYYRSIENRNVTDSTINYEHQIVLKDNISVASKPRLLPPTYEEEIDTQIRQLLKADIIKPSHSSYASPVVPGKKKDGSVRLCCDFRKLNEKIFPNVYPIPTTENIFEKFKGAAVFTVLDLKSAYWLIRIKAEDKEKTAFVHKDGKYHWNVVPFGINRCGIFFGEGNAGIAVRVRFRRKFLRPLHSIFM